MLEMISELNEPLDEAEAGGGPDHHKRLAARGKLQFEKEFSTSWIRESLEISGLAAYKSEYPIGGGAFAGIEYPQESSV